MNVHLKLVPAAWRTVYSDEDAFDDQQQVFGLPDGYSATVQRHPSGKWSFALNTGTGDRDVAPVGEWDDPASALEALRKHLRE